MYVRDLGATIRFYTEGLGFEARLAWGEPSRRTVLLDTGDGNYLEVTAGGSEAFDPNGLVRHFALRTDDCSKAIERARAAGAEVTVEARDVVLSSEPPTPVRVAFCRDPDGEVIEFFEGELT